jgi:hypothetical protein
VRLIWIAPRRGRWRVDAYRSTVYKSQVCRVLCAEQAVRFSWGWRHSSSRAAVRTRSRTRSGCAVLLIGGDHGAESERRHVVRRLPASRCRAKEHEKGGEAERDAPNRRPISGGSKRLPLPTLRPTSAKNETGRQGVDPSQARAISTQGARLREDDGSRHSSFQLGWRTSGCRRDGPLGTAW